MKKFNLLYLILFFVGTASTVNAQFITDSQGRVRMTFNPEEGDIDGSPFEYDAWGLGKAVDNKGVSYRNLRIKYNAYNDVPVFAGANNEMLAFPSQIATFTYNDKIYACGFPKTGKLTDSSYYQVLDGGETQLLKRNVKALQVVKTYNTAIPIYKFSEEHAYFLFKNGQMREFKPGKSSIFSILGDKSAELKVYLATNKINFSDDLALAKLLNYYNSL